MHILTRDVVADKYLQASGDVLNRRKAGFTHDAFEDYATGDLYRDLCRVQLFSGFVGIQLIKSIG